MTTYTVAFALCHPFVLLIRKDKPDWQRGLLNGIGGKVEEGETIPVATMREFQEETGLVLSDREPLIYHAMLWPNYLTHTNWPLVYFSAFNITKKEMLEATRNTIGSKEPCVPTNLDHVNRLNTALMPNLPFLVEMALCMCDCKPEVRELRQNIVFPPEVFQRYIDEHGRR